MKSLIKRLFSFFGYQLSKKQNRGWNTEYIKSLSDANIVLDIGAAYGTPVLYDAFKERKFVLFEPPLLEIRMVRLN